MKSPKKAILDGDIIAYRAACWADVEGSSGLATRLWDAIEHWTPKGVDEIVIAFSCYRKDNFRRDFWPKYKAKRDSVATPDTLGECKDYIKNYWDTISEPRIEADDLMGIYVSEGDMLGVTIDKDLLTIPGFHWNPDKDKDIRFITEEEADRAVYRQWMTGDSTDGVPGLWRIGPKKANKFLDEWEREEWTEKILNMYRQTKYQIESTFLPDVLALAMARSVRILRTGEYDFTNQEISLWNPIVGHNDDKE